MPTARPILMSAPMVRALLAGTKTQTRRIIKPQPERFAVNSEGLADGLCEVAVEITDRDPLPRLRLGRVITMQTCPYGKPGGLLWVRETAALECSQEVGWYDPPFQDGRPMKVTECEYWGKYWTQPHYRATDPAPELDIGKDDPGVRWTPAIHMPRWASRLTLEITQVRVERLHDISDVDAKAEGAEQLSMDDDCKFYRIAGQGTYRTGYAGLWNHINGDKNGADWDANPWVWALTFKVHKTNVDALLRTAVAEPA